MIEQLIRWIKDAHQIVIMTGAGASVESGLATFRGAASDEEEAALWEQYDPHQLASAEGFFADPVKVWQWYQWRRRQVLSAKPNRAHAVIAWLEQNYSVSLITQNVDGLHQRAGSQNIFPLHGEILRNICTNRHCQFEEKIIDAEAELSHCVVCGEGYLRPGVVWFGESLDTSVLAAAESATMRCNLFLSVGTSSQVYPAAGFAQLAKLQGAKVVEINIKKTALSSSVDLMINHEATKVFDQIYQHLESRS